MLRFLFFLLFLLLANPNFAQTNAQEDVVYMKNGSVLRGSILEQTPNVSLKIQIIGNNIFVLKMDEVERIVKENISLQTAQNSTKQQINTPEEPETAFKSGLNHTIRAGALIALGEYGGIGASANYALGWQFNRNISLGIGTGFDYYTSYWTSVPAFLDLRITPISKGKIIPVFALAGGYSAGSFYGLMLNPSIGLKIKMSPKAAFLIDLGYKHQSGFVNIPLPGGEEVQSGTAFTSLALNLGLQF